MFLKVPIDIVPPEELSNVLSRMLESVGTVDNPSNPSLDRGQNIVLLSLSDLLRARRKGEYRNYVMRAALVVPISKSIVSGAKFLTGTQLFRYMPFHFVISLLSLLEKKNHSLYLIGDKTKSLRKAEKNISTTFPQLSIVGRR